MVQGHKEKNARQLLSQGYGFHFPGLGVLQQWLICVGTEVRGGMLIKENTGLKAASAFSPFVLPGSVYGPWHRCGHRAPAVSLAVLC